MSYSYDKRRKNIKKAKKLMATVKIPKVELKHEHIVKGNWAAG